MDVFGLRLSRGSPAKMPGPVADWSSGKRAAATHLGATSMRLSCRYQSNREPICIPKPLPSQLLATAYAFFLSSTNKPLYPPPDWM